MDINNLLGQFWQTKKHLTTAVLGAAGWDIRQFHGEASSGPQVFVYTFDQPTGFVWMCSMPRVRFVEVTTEISKKPKMYEAIRSGLLFVLFGAVSGNLPPPSSGGDWEQQLGLLLAFYAGTTRTLELANKMQGGGHFIVMNYRKSKDEKESNLRPFVLADTGNTVLSADALAGYIEQVMEIDQVRHPEWFR